MTETPAGLHAHTRLDLRNHVRAHRIVTASPGDHLETIGVAARQVQQVHAREGDEETAEEREGVDGVGGIETAVEYERGTEGRGREGNVVQGVDAAQMVRNPGTFKMCYRAGEG